jgi:hypothetical protein
VEAEAGIGRGTARTQRQVEVGMATIYMFNLIKFLMCHVPKLTYSAESTRAAWDGLDHQVARRGACKDVSHGRTRRAGAADGDQKRRYTINLICTQHNTLQHGNTAWT